MSAGLGERHRTVEVVNLVDTADEGGHDLSPLPQRNPNFAQAVPAVASPILRTPSTSPEDDAPRILQAAPAMPRGGMMINVDGEEVFIPDDEDGEDYAPSGDFQADSNDFGRTTDVAASLTGHQVTTAEDCLHRVLEIFQDISHEYVYKLYNDFDHEGDYQTLPPLARLDNIIEQLISAPTYPKQDKGKKRKRAASQDHQPDKFYEQKDRAPPPAYYRNVMQHMLKSDFPEIPVQYINDTLAAERHFYHAYVLLARIKDTSDRSNKPYGRGRPSSKNIIDAERIANDNGWADLVDELLASRRTVATMRAERIAEEARTKAEQENLQKAIAAGETAECSACYDELPMNRQLHCNGSVAHFTCFSCAETYIKSEVGESRCRVLCPAGCGAGFAHNQLDLLADKALLEKLAQIQQEKDIRDAGLDNLEECPFCDYKAILPPVDEDFEFRCANPDCEKVSCRRCKAISHVPVSCEQHAKDHKINHLHVIEEAMTAALIRSCNKCKKQFIKEYGCNKMTCSSCGNLQCYVCSASVKNYEHFNHNYAERGAVARPAVGASKQERCPLYDNVEERHEREVKEAEAAARAQVVEENPDLESEDLEIRMSDAVKKATADRIRQSADDPDGLRPLGAYRPAFGVFNMMMPDDFPFIARPAQAGDAVDMARRRGVEREAMLRGLRGLDYMRDAAPAAPRPAGPGAFRAYIPVVGYPADPLRAAPMPMPIPAPAAAPPPRPRPLHQPLPVNAPRPPADPLLPPDYYPQPFDPFHDPNALDLAAGPWRDVEDALGGLGRNYEFGLDGAGEVRRGRGDINRDLPVDPFEDFGLGQDRFLANNDDNILGAGLGRPDPRLDLMTPPARDGLGQGQDFGAGVAAALLDRAMGRRPGHQQEQPAPQLINRPLPQPVFQPNIRQHRQAFQHLEHLRTDHDRMALDRDAERQREEQRRQELRRQQVAQMDREADDRVQQLRRDRLVEEHRAIQQQFVHFGQQRGRDAAARRRR